MCRESLVKLTEGWSAYSQGQFDKAIAAGDSLLANSPYDPSATVLKSRALVAMNREDEAEAILLSQIQSQPSDPAVWKRSPGSTNNVKTGLRSHRLPADRDAQSRRPEQLVSAGPGCVSFGTWP